MRRLAMTVLGAVLMVAGLGSAASAQDEAPDAGQVDVLEVAGYLDPVLVDFISTSIDEAEDEGAIGVVLQMNSPGVAVTDAEFTELADQILDAGVRCERLDRAERVPGLRRCGRAGRGGRRDRDGARHPAG